MDNTDLIAQMEYAATALRELLDRFEQEQDENSDEGNADHLNAARRGLDDVTGAIGDLVP